MKKEEILDALDRYTVALFLVTDDRYVSNADITAASFVVSATKPASNTAVWLKPIKTE